MDESTIQGVVDKFLKTYHPSLSIPIPIESIIEFSLGMDIIPIPGLHDLIDTDGWLSQDLKTISIDQFVYEKRPKRYRFSLAHEIGHFILHPNIFKSLCFSDTKEWKKIYENMDSKTYRKLEFQANNFAGRLLVPQDLLQNWLKKEKNLSTNEELGNIEKILYTADRFDVSETTAEIRLRKEGLI